MQLLWKKCDLYTGLYSSSIVKKTLFAYENHAQILSWNQPVLSNEGKVSSSRKQWEPLMGLELTDYESDALLIFSLTNSQNTRWLTWLR